MDRLSAYDGPEFVVILDEVDQLQDERVLYDLYRTRGISMILIANQETELFTRLDDRLVSQLHAATRIRIEKYELLSIVGTDQERRLLTDRQRELLEIAVRQGYFEIPRNCTLAELAE